MEKSRRFLGILVGCLSLGVVSYLMLADTITCFVGTTCNGTNRSDRIIIISSAETTSSTGTTVNAGAGNDRVTVQSNITAIITINGGDGNDIIFDGGGRSPLNGEAGNDIIYGNGGDDTINGGLGNDVIDPGPGQDTGINGMVNGGGGNDTFILRRGESGGTERILCTATSQDRGLVKLVGYSKDDPALPWQSLNVPLTDPNFNLNNPTHHTEIPDGTNRFRIYHGPGRCKIIVSSR